MIPAVPALAQQSLAPVVVTGLREPQPLDRVVGDLVVIDAERIRDAAVDSIEDLLRRVGGIQLSRTGGPGQAAGALLRGHSSANTVVLIDGVRVGSATAGLMDLSSLSLAQIERIEILRGPGSSLYGADAVGGVVQIITRRGDGEPTLSGRLAVGPLNSSEAEVALRGAGGGIDYAVGASHERSDGVSAVREGDAFGLANPDRDGFKREGVHASVGFTPVRGQRFGVKAQRSQLRAQFDSAEYPPPTFAPDPTPDFRNRLDTELVAADWRGVMSETLTLSFQASDQRDDLESGANTLSRFDTRRRQYSGQAAIGIASEQRLVAALERLEESVDTSAYGSPSRSTNSLVLAWSARFGAHRLQADARHDDSSVSGRTETGKLGWAWEPAPNWSVRLGAGSAFRAPSFNELYFPNYGVVTLRPERSEAVEAGLQWRGRDSAAGVTVYRHRVRDLIAYESDRSFCPPDPGYDFGCARNINRARLQGATLSAEQRLGAWSLRAAIDFLDAKDRATGERLARRAAHQESVSLDWSDDTWAAGGSILAVGARPDGGTRLAAYQLVDLYTRYRVTRTLRIEAKLLNALDRDVEPARDYRGPGRQAWIGVRYDGAGL